MALTRDAFLGGRVMLWQPDQGYRAGVDPVLLAAACPAKPGDHVLELGCGVGAASLCLAARVPDLTLVGVERQADIAQLARRNAAEAGARMHVETADLTDLPQNIKDHSFDHVIANPPYFLRNATIASDHAAREAAMGEDTPLDLWLATAARRLKPRGWLTLIHRPERLDDVLAGLANRLGSVSILPLTPRTGRPASLILVRSRKDGRTPLQLCAPMILHQGTHHTQDGDDYAETATQVLRNGAAIQWPSG